MGPREGAGRSRRVGAGRSRRVVVAGRTTTAEIIDISIRYEGGVIGFTLSQPRSPDAAVTKKTPKRLRIWLGLVVFRHTLGPRTGNVMLRCVAAAILAIGVMGVALAGCSDSSSSSLLIPPTEFLQFETVPPGADVQTAGGQTCRTPCSLAMPLAAQSVSLAMNGYTPQTVALGLRQDNMFSPVVLAPNPVTVTLQAVPKPVRTPKSRKVPGRAKVATKPAAPPPVPIPAAGPTPKQDNAAPAPPPAPSPVESRFWTPPPQTPPTR